MERVLGLCQRDKFGGDFTAALIYPQKSAARNNQGLFLPPLMDFPSCFSSSKGRCYEFIELITVTGSDSVHKKCKDKQNQPHSHGSHFQAEK